MTAETLSTTTPLPSEEMGRVIVHEVVEASGPTAEQLHLLDASANWARTLTERYPQVDDDGNLSYILAGSFASMLLAQASEITVIPIAGDVRAAARRSVSIPLEASQRFKSFARHLGDMDIESVTRPAAADKIGRSPLPAANNLGVLDEETRYLMQVEPERTRIKVDVRPATRKDAARITVGGMDFYIHEPVSMLAWKVDNMLQNLDIASSKTKYTEDFVALFEGLSRIYPVEELAQATHDLLLRGGSSDTSSSIPWHNERFDPRLGRFVEQALGMDADAPYLDQLTHSRERAINILDALHHYPVPEQKQQIIDFIKTHQSLISKWTVNEYSDKNRQILIDAVRSNPDVLHKLVNRLAPGERQELLSADFETWLGANAAKRAIIGRAAEVVDDSSELEYRVERSYCLAALKLLDPEHLEDELATLESLFSNPAFERSAIASSGFVDILRNKQFKTSTVRQAVMRALRSDTDKLPHRTVSFLLMDLERAVDRRQDSDTAMTAVLEEYGLAA